MFIPPPTFCLQFEKMCSINGRRLRISSKEESRKKYILQDFKFENNTIVQEDNVENINTRHPRAHFFFIYNGSSVFTLEK